MTHTNISGHSPVRLNLGGNLNDDIGSKIKRPVDFQGTTRKDARLNNPTEGDFEMKGKSRNQKWKHWTEASEEFLAQAESKTVEEYFGRSKPIDYVKKHDLCSSR
eukprot:16365540-Heterocapsa_arctica.AAC.1